MTKTRKSEIILGSKSKSMEQIKPTVFNLDNANKMPTAEQLFCGKALDAVIALG